MPIALNYLTVGGLLAIGLCHRVSYRAVRETFTAEIYRSYNKQSVWEAATICPAPCKLTIDLLTLKVVVGVSHGVFHSRLKTHLFSRSFSPVTFLSL